MVNYCSSTNAGKALIPGQAPPPGLACSVYRNDGQPAPIPGKSSPGLGAPGCGLGKRQGKRGAVSGAVPWTGVEPLLGRQVPHSGIAVLDLDGDRDLDLVLSADGAPPVAILNDRLGNFHDLVLKEVASLAMRSRDCS